MALATRAATPTAPIVPQVGTVPLQRVPGQVADHPQAEEPIEPPLTRAAPTAFTHRLRDGSVRDSLRENGGQDGLGQVRGPASGKRGADLLERLVAQGGAWREDPSPRWGPGRRYRFTRFLRNPSVTIGEMVATAFRRTEVACAGRDVLAVQDTTSTRGSAGGQGSFLHAMIAVDAVSGAVLGALDALFLERTEGGRASRLQRAFEDRQSIRWLEATRRAGDLRGAARVTVVADREADMFELFAQRPAYVDLVVRALHDRALAGGGKMAATIAAGPRLGQAALDLPARPGMPARTARLSIRFGAGSGRRTRGARAAPRRCR